MSTKTLGLVCLILVLCTGGAVQAAEFYDDFNTPHDYRADGVTGTGWDGFVGLGAGETVDELNASIDRAGQLYIQSTGARWEPDWNPLGPFLYKVVYGDFIATVKVTDFAGCPTPPVYHNDCGLMARVPELDAAGPGEDAMTVQFFATWSGNIYRIIDDGSESELGATGDGCSAAQYLQLERIGNDFYCRISDNDTNWVDLGLPVERSDMDGLGVQVGLWQCTYDITTGYAAFDDFTLIHWGEMTQAMHPNPQDEAPDVPINVDLSWTPGEKVQDVNGHEVYIGSDFNDVNDANATSHPNVDLYIVSDPCCDVGQLELNQTYFWRVDEVNEPQLWKGEVWSFTTETGKAMDPVPDDGDKDVDPNVVLVWTPSSVAATHDVYFGTDEAAVLDASRPAGDVDGDGDVDWFDVFIVSEQWLQDPPGGSQPSADLNGDDSVNGFDFSTVAGDWGKQASNVFKGNQDTNSYYPGPLNPGTTYYWRIDEVNASEPGSPWTGDVWSFTTGTPPVEWVFITVDPPDRLMNALVLGEWSTPGDLEGWTGNDVSGLSSESGYLTGIGSAASPSVQKTSFSGPDLDFGYFDYLQIQIKVPAGFNDDIIFYFGTSENSGFASNRVFRIPASYIPQDGQWHSYRLDLGLVVWWRDSLTDLQIKPLGNLGDGRQFFIDYVEVGDLPGDVLLINWDLNVNTGAGETIDDCNYMESKHAVFWWSPQSYVQYTSFNPTVMGRRALRMIEECYQVYRKKLNYDEPFESFDLWRRDGNRYKINHVTWYGGFWCGGWNGFMHIGIPGSGLLDEGWGNPMPHEFGHCIQGHQLGFLAGGHWESHTNFLRQAWQLHYAERFPTDQQSQLDLQIYELSNLRQDHGRLIYRDFRIHQALQDYADDMGLDSGLVGKFWTEPPKEMTVYDKLSQMLPGGFDIKDVVAFGLRHWPFLDFEDGDKFKNQLWSTSDNKAWHDYVTGSLLIPCQDKPGWWRCPFERAPERFGYMYHELDPTQNIVTVDFQGFDLLESTEDWRWSLAAVDNADNVRFSDLWAPGTNSFILNPGETKVYLIVVPTPSDTSLNLEWTDNRLPVDKHIDRLHYAYEVGIVGAMPAKRQLNWSKGSGHYHSNGGGWVDNTATVHSTAYVGPNAMVLGYGKVYNYARIEDYAVIKGSATARDYATVSGYSVVMDNATVRNYAKVRDRAIVEDSAIVEGNGVVEDYAHLSGSINIKDSAIARGVCVPWDGTISGTAIIGYDYSMSEDLSDGVNFCHVPWGDWYVPYWVQTKAKPRGLVASYRIEEPEGDVCWDEFGAQHAVLRGSPQRVDDAYMNSQVLRLDGSSQYVVLDRSLYDLSNGSFGLWVKPTSNTNRPLLFMGGSATKYLQLALDGSGHARFTITDGGAPQELVSTSVIPVGSWTHIAVTLNGSQGALYVNGGAPEDTSAITLVPDDVLGSNDYTEAEALYVGRDWAGNLYAGDLEDIRFYNVALTQAEVDNEIRRAGDVIGVFYYNAPQNFDGSTTEAQSGVRNGLERVLEASIYPDTSDNVTYYEAVLDSTDEEGGGFEGSGFGLDNGEILVRLENVGFWRTGVYVTLGQWQKITVVFNGSTAELYVNDVPQDSTSYSATEADVAGKNYRIGFAMDTGSNKYYFDGQIKDVFIYDKTP